jgi:putative aldouronate transport system permease protein
MILSRGERLFNAINILIMAVIMMVTLFPLLYIVSVSLTPLTVLYKYGGFRIIPPEITFDAYRYIFSTPMIPQAFMNSVAITALGTTVNMVLTVLMAYPLSRKRMPGRNAILLLVLFTMLFGGGTIPTYILVKSLGLLNSYWAVILPGAISSFNLLVMKGFFESLPDELFEAARMDGASEWRVLGSIALPLSMPVLATLGLFYAVAHWNAFFEPMMYLTDQRLQPLQVILRNILSDTVKAAEFAPDAGYILPGETMKMATVVVSIVPLLLVYPWLQKYFTKGVLVGSIKG